MDIKEELIEAIPGYIYKITCNKTDRCYIGSTKHDIYTRLSQHLKLFRSYLKNSERTNYTTSFDILEGNDFKIEVIDFILFVDLKQLKNSERLWIQTTKCVNKNIPGRTIKEYYNDNREKIIKQQTEYNKKHTEHIMQQKKTYYQKNKDRLINYQREYYKKKHLATIINCKLI